MNHYKMMIKMYIMRFAFTYVAMDYGTSYGRQVISNTLAMFRSSVTARPTDQPTDRRTDRASLLRCYVYGAPKLGR